MLLEDKKNFNDLIESVEAIATNIVSARLKMLDEPKIIRKEKPPQNKKTNIYRLLKRDLV